MNQRYIEIHYECKLSVNVPGNNYTGHIEIKGKRKKRYYNFLLLNPDDPNRAEMSIYETDSKNKNLCKLVDAVADSETVVSAIHNHHRVPLFRIDGNEQHIATATLVYMTIKCCIEQSDEELKTGEFSFPMIFSYFGTMTTDLVEPSIGPMTPHEFPELVDFAKAAFY